LLHYGHIRHLQKARQLGDRLKVGVLTTEATMERKPRPIIPQARRMEQVSALRCVDQVVVQKSYSPLDNVRRYRPDVLAESEDHSLEDVLEGCRGLGVRVEVLPYTKGISSTKIKGAVVEAAGACRCDKGCAGMGEGPGEGRGSLT